MSVYTHVHVGAHIRLRCKCDAPCHSKCSIQIFGSAQYLVEV